MTKDVPKTDPPDPKYDADAERAFCRKIVCRQAARGIKSLRGVEWVVIAALRERSRKNGFCEGCDTPELCRRLRAQAEAKNTSPAAARKPQTSRYRRTRRACRA